MCASLNRPSGRSFWAAQIQKKVGRKNFAQITNTKSRIYMKQAIPRRPDSLRDQAINRILSQRTERELQLAAELAVYKGFAIFMALLAFTKIGVWQ